MLTLTDKGAEKVQEFLAGQDNPQVTGLRVGVRGGGCSGFQYLLAFDEQRDGDTVVTERGIKLLVDNSSIPYVQGSTIDYVESLQGAGFQVNNPNVVAACGCGSSFRVAEDGRVVKSEAGSGEGLLRVDETKSAAGRRTIPLPRFAVEMLMKRRHLPYLGEQTVIFPSTAGTLATRTTS